MPVSPEQQAKVAEALYESQLIKFGEFTLKSGLKSPFYIDLRQAQSYPETFHTIVETYGQMLEDVDSTVLLAGVPEAGTPLAAATGYATKRKLVQPRKVVKDHGTKSSVEGAFNEGDRVVMLDDLITKGDSKLEAINQVESAGLAVERFIVLVDREQGGMETIAKAGYNIEAAVKVSSIIELLHASGKISAEQKDTILSFIANN